MMTTLRVSTTRGTAQIQLLRKSVSRKIDPYDLLVEAMCRQASRDLMAKDYEISTDAMEFFRSKWFEYLTDLDGEEIINTLLSKRRKKNGN